MRELPLKKHLERVFAVWNCACAHAACTAPDVLCSRIFPVSAEIRPAMALITGMPTMTAVVMMARNASGMDGEYALGGVFYHDRSAES
ncbi:MAG: hypothetical protein ACLTTJ_14345 [Blautia sp.]